MVIMYPELCKLFLLLRSRGNGQSWMFILHFTSSPRGHWPRTFGHENDVRDRSSLHTRQILPRTEADMQGTCMQRILKQAVKPESLGGICRKFKDALDSIHGICAKTHPGPTPPPLQESCFKSSVVNSSPWPSKWMCLKMFD